MSNENLTTEEVRDSYVTGCQLPHYELGNPNDAKSTAYYEAEFDAWLAALKIEWTMGAVDLAFAEAQIARAEGWDEGAEETTEYFASGAANRNVDPPHNPYYEE